MRVCTHASVVGSSSSCIVSTDKARFDEHAGKILDVEYYQHRVTLLEGKPDVTKLQKKKDRLANGEARPLPLAQHTACLG